MKNTLTVARRANKRFHTQRIFSSARQFEPAASIDGIRLHALDCLGNVFRRQPSGKKKLRHKLSSVLRDFPIDCLSGAATKTFVKGVEHDCINRVTGCSLRLKRITNAQRLDYSYAAQGGFQVRAISDRFVAMKLHRINT